MGGPDWHYARFGAQPPGFPAIRSGSPRGSQISVYPDDSGRGGLLFRIYLPALQAQAGRVADLPVPARRLRPGQGVFVLFRSARGPQRRPHVRLLRHPSAPAEPRHRGPALPAPTRPLRLGPAAQAGTGG